MGPFVEMLSRTISRYFQVLYEPSTTQLKIHADAGELELVLLNLCFNARDSIEGKGSIWVSINPANLDTLYLQRYPELAGTAYVCISIKDDRCEIDPESMGKILILFIGRKQRVLVQV